MHHFHDLISRSTTFTLNALSEAYNRTVDSLQESGRTSDVKNLQMINLQKAILAVGMFSIFDSELQNKLPCKNGFKGAREFLKQMGENELDDQFNMFILAINVLKHGFGQSYNALVQRSDSLPFEMILPNSTFYIEGDVSEINTLIKVDDNFVLNCADLISAISNVISRNKS